MPTPDALVVFTPSGRRGRFQHGLTVLEAARSLGVDLDSVCGGRGLCGRCQVSVSTGTFAKLAVASDPSHLEPPGAAEQHYVANRGLAPGRRLACHARIAGDLVLDVPPESQIHRQVVRKDASQRTIAVDPLVRLHYVELSPPSLKDPASDACRLQETLAAQWDIADVQYSVAALATLGRALRQGDWKATVAVREAREVVAIWPGFRDRALGLAVDIGTTTIAAHLCDLESGAVLAAAGAMNPQIRFGEDVMSRISYMMQNPTEAGALTASVREAVMRLADETARAAAAARTDIVEATFVGNPAMHHIFLGIDPAPLGAAPYTLTVDAAQTPRCSEIGLDFAPGAHAHLLPCIAGHVGADTAGMILSEAPHRADEMVLLIDVGTNAELVLGNRDKLVACSSPTGPAFEGAQISAGQRAAPGAIERVRIDRATLRPRVKVIGCDLWSDQPGFEDAIAATGVTGICGSGIIEAVAEMHLSGIIAKSGLVNRGLAERSAHVVPDNRAFAYRLYAGSREILITQTDVRAVQLAKAALYAGAQLLMDRLGIKQVDRIVLGGAFGSYIDPYYALALGMVPDCPIERIRAVGNAASTGARFALVNRAARAEIEAIVRAVEKVETAADRRFQSLYVAAMAIPHSVQTFAALRDLATVP